MRLISVLNNQLFMKTKILHPVRCLLLASVFFLAGVALKAQNAFTESFDNFPVLNGMLVNNAGACATAEWLDAPVNTNGILRFYANNQGGRRNSTFTFSSAVDFTKKAIVELDWYPAAYSGGNGDEGQISFRNGTGDDNVLFTLYNLRGSNNEIGLAVGTLNGGKAATVNQSCRSSVAATLSRWYHVKAEIYAGQRIDFTITGDDGYNRQVMIPVPSGFDLTGISNVYINATRASNITWNTMIDNIAVKNADDAANTAATGVTVTSQYDIIAAGGGAAALSASVEPFGVSDHSITWSVDNDLATVTAGYPSWTATISGAGAGSGQVTVTAASATAGVVGTKTVTVSATPITLNSITVSGNKEVSVNGTVTLTAAVGPGNASDKNIVWSSSDPGIAAVDPNTGVVTGVKGGNATITATAADGGGASGDYEITVIFYPLTGIDLRGARRIFYTPDPATVPPFALTPVVLPANASNKTLNWSVLDAAIAAVDATGRVTLAGGFGKTAIKAEATDGSNTAAYYYIEVAAESPYDGFTDFETGVAPFSGSASSFQDTRALYWSVSNQAGSRSNTFSLSNVIEGGIINLRFDWFAGRVISTKNTGILTIQDGTPGTANMILSFIFADVETPENHIRYLTGNYISNADNPPQGISLEQVTALDRWYTVDVTMDYFQSECSFTITDRDDPSKFQTVEHIPFSPANPPQANVKSLFVNGLRASGNNITLTSAIDNFGYKVIDANLPTYAVTGLSIDGLDHVAPGGKILVYPRIQPGNALNKELHWESQNPEIATVEADADGRVIVTGISAGTATIKAISAENSDISAEKTVTVETVAIPQRQMEKIDRGLVAVKTGDGVFTSWRLLGTDPAGVQFNLYKKGVTNPVNPDPLSAAYTDFTDPDGTVSDQYSVAVLVDGTEVYRSASATVWDKQYLSIPVQMPETGHMPDGASYDNYTVYDGSTADLDGDGQYEIVFLWSPANMQDNSTSNPTANVFIDAYKLDGTKLWGAGKYIDLGVNIRAGAHYTQLMVYDFDGDGKAEIIVRTSDGTRDAAGRLIGEDVSHVTGGVIITGPEYLSVFEGATGRALASVPYEPPRGDVWDWGDGQGNRSDRFLAAVAYLDGVHPSVVMCRGYYTRTTLCAWDWDGTNLAKRWMFDSDVDGKHYAGQGNHNLSVADVDMDGRDEIIYGSLTIDDNGKAMYTTGLGHGDAMHVGKLDPARPGLQMVGVHESPFPYGLEMHDLMTGDLIWSVVSSSDIGRGLTADVDPEYPGEEAWSAGGLGTYSATGVKLAGSISSMNMAIYWDGDTGRELLDGGNNPSVTKITASNGSGSNLRSYSSQPVFTFTGASTNGGTKNNPCLQADILGDWREEVILRSSDNSELRIYTTVEPTVHTGAGAVPESGIPSLMHNKEYRLAVAWQNVAYNQPPHTDFFLGYNMPEVERGAEGKVITVTFEPNGGVFADNTTENKVIPAISGAYLDLPAISKTGSAFGGWYFADGSRFDPAALYAENITLRAEWLNDASLATLTVDGKEAGLKTGSNTVYEITVTHTTQVVLDATANSLKAVVKADDLGAKAVQPGLNTFSIQVTAGDGTVQAYSLEVTVTTTTGTGDFESKPLMAYPNPARDYLVVDNLQGSGTLAVFDASGKQILSRNITSVNETLNVSNWPQGGYFIRITEGKTVKTIHFIVNK
jgi:rhamnogalacturonan endolyase